MGDESIWKKEISFGRKRKEDAPAEREATEESTSVWKKEISFGRKRQEREPDPEVVSEAVEEPAPSEETWTRAVSFGRRAQPAPEPEPVAEVPVVEVPVAEESPAVEEPVVEAPVADAPAPVVQLPVAAAEAEPATDEVVEEPAQPEETWTRTVSFGRKSQPDAEPVAEVPVAEVPVAEAEDVVEAPVAGEPAVVQLPVAAEPATDDGSAVSGPDPEPGPEQAAPDAPVAAAPVAVEPVWTKEVSLSRAPDPAPAPEPAPGVHAPVTADQLAQLDEPEPEKSVPFWKKEIGGKKKPKAERAPVTSEAVAVDDAEPEKNVPFWKKDIGGKKTPKAERAPKQPRAKKEKQPKEPREPKALKQRKPKEPKVKAARGSRGAKRITGLKIGASQLAAARIANNGSAELLQVARTPLEPGIVVGGELRDPDALAEALKKFFSANNLPKKGVRLGIANNRIGVRTFEIAGIDDEKQLANAIRFRAQEALPIPIDEAVLDYQVLGEGTDEQGQPTKRILLVVAYRELIDRYMNACKKAGISLVGIDLEAFALLRALQAPQDGVGGDSAAALVAVAIGHDRSTFAVSDGRICEFTRVLEWGGSALNVAIARALDAAPSEVDGVKRALALTDEMVPEGLSEEQAKKARDAMRRAIQTFARELVSSLQYYQNQPGSLGIGEIVLTGGTAHLAGLAGELERLIGVRVRVGDPLARMKVSKKVGEAEQVGSLAVAIGLGIED
jgi:type IV pilus assembly protein PilM